MLDTCKTSWKRHQDTVFWIDIDLGIIKEGLKFHQTRSNAIILQVVLPPSCIVRAERLKSGEPLYKRQYLSPRPPPKISLRHDLNWTRGNDELGSTVEHRPVGKLVQQSLGETVHFGFSKPTQFPKTNENRSGKPIAQEIVSVLQEELSSSDRPGKPATEEEQHVRNHDGSGKPDGKEKQHTVQNYHLKSRDTVDKFDLATDDTNVDFSVSGITEEAVKRSENFNILQLIRRITRHPQKQAVQNDLDQEQSFNAFSAESKKAIKKAGNIEISEIINAEPKWQCKSCLKHCNPGVIYCVCRRLMSIDRPSIESISHPPSTHFPYRASTSEKTDHVITGMEKPQDAKNTIRRTNLQRNAVNNYTKSDWARACQDSVAGGNGWSRCRYPFWRPSLSYPRLFQEF